MHNPCLWKRVQLECLVLMGSLVEHADLLPEVFLSDGPAAME